jgi:ATP-dependent helicase HepA
MADFKPGQKWISNAEPELGMGQVMHIRDRLVSVYFDMASEERTYARQQAPLTRVKFNAGDRIKTNDDLLITVKSVVDKDDIFIYHGDYNGTNTAVVETELDPNVRFSKPEERLFTHQIDDNHWFNLRYRTLLQMSRLAQAKSRGLYGPRVSLIPHQLYIGGEIASRFAPRVLLADEVGLGKTIEAGLITHRQLLTGRANRVLVIVPAALTFQWFVEMIRRFNLQFTVMDEQRCLSIEEDNAPEFEDDERELDNPFEAQQLVLCSLNLFSDNPLRLQHVLAAEWDLVVVDEAHHLQWTPEQTSPEYRIVELISQVSKGLLLLTATPEQLGRTGHFARLRLLDPNRFHDYNTFLQEESSFETIANHVTQLMDGDESESAAARAEISMLISNADPQAGNDELVHALLDRHGTGRVLFRNVRSSVKGFPQRIVHSYPLVAPSSYDKTSFYPETEHAGWVDVDPRADWLIALLQDSDHKHLVICGNQRTAMDLEKRIRENTTIRSTVFHEGMDLVARDRSANYFSESLRGAQVMICSEIGSEGRNFQFASQLVLFDLPPAPDLLEQRIGRLDRIGQANDVNIHVPYLADTAQDRLFHWYHLGMELFSEPNPVAQTLADELSSDLLQADFDAFITRTRLLNQQRREMINKGRDRLLELNSHRPDVSADIVADVAENQGGETLESYMEYSFDLFGLESEPLGDDVLSVKPTESMIRNFSVSLETQDHFHYPELPEDGIRFTYERETALSREDVSFFTWENPIVQQALDTVASDVTGNSTMIAIKHPALKPGTLLVESLFVVDCVAPAELNVSHYLPPSVIRCLVTPTLDDVSSRIQFQDFTEELLEVPVTALQKILDSQIDGIKAMLEQSRSSAENRLATLLPEAAGRADRELNTELHRLEDLSKVNANIREEEIEYLRLTQELIREAIDNAQMRLDAIRVIVAA